MHIKHDMWGTLYVAMTIFDTQTRSMIAYEVRWRASLEFIQRNTCRHCRNRRNRRHPSDCNAPSFNAELESSLLVSLVL